MTEPSRTHTALVVDDDPAGRAFLRALLKRAGYAVEIAVSGEDALERFVPGEYDVVFMDVMMPGIDGIETTRRLKARAGDTFTPVIFVTGADDEDCLVRAIDAGGDDFLTKPVTPGVLLAKLSAMERIRAVHARTRALYARLVEDQEMAREVFDRAVGADGATSASLCACLVPAEVFSGDLLLSAISPEGRLFVLFGDFTGHGLAAALGGLPAAHTFRGMVANDFAPEEIMVALNERIAEVLPRGHFLAASLVCVDPGLKAVRVVNCGMPPLLLRAADGRVRARIESGCFSLGIMLDAPILGAFRDLPIEAGESLVLASDGVTEALDDAGEAFGEARLDALLVELAGADSLPHALIGRLDRFRGAVPLADDASIVEMRFNQCLFSALAERAAMVHEAEPVEER
jgi:DNA-binding response OmpR family regulator